MRLMEKGGMNLGKQIPTGFRKRVLQDIANHLKSFDLYFEWDRKWLEEFWIGQLQDNSNDWGINWDEFRHRQENYYAYC